MYTSLDVTPEVIEYNRDVNAFLYLKIMIPFKWNITDKGQLRLVQCCKEAKDILHSAKIGSEDDR